MDVDQNLLHQFSCMGTSDKDDLVKQLLRLLAGSQLNETTATFFLDMNNWNLQAAICSYLDFQVPIKLPSMALLCDSTIGEGESVPPNTKFRKSWQIQNSGTETWPEGTVLHYTGGELMGDAKVDVPSLSPKETIEFGMTFTSPRELGVHQCKMRMMTVNGSYFGDIIWVIVTVSESGTLAVTQQLNDVQMC